MRRALNLGRAAAALAAAGWLGAGCGRIGIDARDGGGGLDSQHVCPPSTAPIAPGAETCIEIAERGSATWIDANALCQGLERRLCTDAEWALACRQASGVTEMVDANSAQQWEWMADMLEGVAKKRGLSSCEDTSSHEIGAGSYDFRCCAPKS